MHEQLALQQRFDDPLSPETGLRLPADSTSLR